MQGTLFAGLRRSSSPIVTLSSVEEYFFQVCATLPSTAKLLWAGTFGTFPIQAITMIRQFLSYFDHLLQNNMPRTLLKLSTYFFPVRRRKSVLFDEGMGRILK